MLARHRSDDSQFCKTFKKLFFEKSHMVCLHSVSYHHQQSMNSMVEGLNSCTTKIVQCATRLRHFVLCDVATLIWCGNSLNQNSNVLFVFCTSCIKLRLHGLEFQLLECVCATSWVYLAINESECLCEQCYAIKFYEQGEPLLM